MNKHNTGPWSFAKHEHEEYGPFSNCHFAIFSTESGGNPSYQVATTVGDVESINEEANARLMAAAPDLLDALFYYRDHCSGAEPSISVFHQKLDAAIAKATGG